MMIFRGFSVSVVGPHDELASSERTGFETVSWEGKLATLRSAHDSWRRDRAQTAIDGLCRCAGPDGRKRSARRQTENGHARRGATARQESAGSLPPAGIGGLVFASTGATETVLPSVGLSGASARM
jgi:hypothetical protein